MRLTYDRSVDMAYLYVGEAGTNVAFSYSCDPQEVKGMINLDFDDVGRLVGIEIAGASQKLARSVLESAESTR